MQQKIAYGPGELWGYRARARDELACVKVLKVGTKRPLRLKIRFVDDEYEGREDWVPPARLKVRWQDRVRFIAAEQRWQTVEDASAEAVDTLEANTCMLVFDHLKALQYIDWRSADRSAILMVDDLGTLEATTGLKREDLLSYPVAYSEDDQIAAPWPALRVVAQALARANAEKLLDLADKEERDRARRAIYGQHYPSRSGVRHIEPEICIEVDREYAPQWEMLRTWCGAEIQARRDELSELRGEVARLSMLVEAAITELDKAGSRKAARRLERELNVPLDLIRASQRRLDS
ncbi:MULTISPECIES: hypothetical protein [Glycomyces]|uniref:PE-PGRS family protein n=2 Tax=Glycomyces TaxID=58113 RepID=A0A9X3SX51_9ACTN|nr:hypothetical protein [Glycomyces lechevalierae]MDA1386612.1 hypothetical protein [Glycomyces lechevalierae]MDR7340680.1 hypothetical protein [Glycomyces lechevalierae]